MLYEMKWNYIKLIISGFGYGSVPRGRSRTVRRMLRWLNQS